MYKRQGCVWDEIFEDSDAEEEAVKARERKREAFFSALSGSEDDDDS